MDRPIVWFFLFSMKIYLQHCPSGVVQCVCILPYHVINLNTRPWHHNAGSMLEINLRCLKYIFKQNKTFQISKIDLGFQRNWNGFSRDRSFGHNSLKTVNTLASKSLMIEAALLLYIKNFSNKTSTKYFCPVRHSTGILDSWICHQCFTSTILSSEKNTFIIYDRLFWSEFMPWYDSHFWGSFFMNLGCPWSAYSGQKYFVQVFFEKFFPDKSSATSIIKLFDASVFTGF